MGSWPREKAGRLTTPGITQVQNQGYWFGLPQHPPNLWTFGACEEDIPINPKYQDLHDTGQEDSQEDPQVHYCWYNRNQRTGARPITSGNEHLEVRMNDYSSFIFVLFVSLFLILIFLPNFILIYERGCKGWGWLLMERGEKISGIGMYYAKFEKNQ